MGQAFQKNSADMKREWHIAEIMDQPNRSRFIEKKSKNYCGAL